MTTPSSEKGRADQRADTSPLPPSGTQRSPRTAAGRRLVALWMGPDSADVPVPDSWLDHILAIEAEAYDEGWRADIGSNGPKAAAEPDAAEPPDPEAARLIIEDWAMIRHHIDEIQRVAQPPRGVTPALDVERLARCPSLMAILNRLGRFNGAWWDRLAAEYARLGSPEDSDATSR